MSTYILMDGMNTFYRSLHAVRGNADLKVGMALHVTLNSIKKAWHDFDADHTVLFLEGRSWRKEVYVPYKANRSVARAALSEEEQEEQKLFFEAFETFQEFVHDKTNATVLQHPNLEADDLIAGFIQMHPNDNHIIISSDSDFHQLIAPNVRQYNGVAETLTTHEGVFDVKGAPVLDKKTKEPLPAPDPEWILFEKCMRGDSSDNIFSAFPGVRTKGSKNKVGLRDAFEDRKQKGWSWNNIMLQRWQDHEGKEHRVFEDYERNRLLIDLTAQPAHIKQYIKETIINYTSNPKDIQQVGVRLMKFCQLFDMKRILTNIQPYAEPFQARYPCVTLTEG